ncbi:flavodoxin [Halolactibacillus alkaliphilus]|uniref:Flavodoxin n=1 Tax=Halolactibacillus alkaliphilus TaxID=442899 RepID=A0A511X3G6_9BACI|nr:flavodoxin domain-containing protein [Halolactibacillus alkaliphilus]GEN57477.1 flavodoxin [Halolactibacillus alkaliphilus]GGN73999.1 flavodoxin [Halolactibacillus alkaliphilus]SFO99771.1 flavodoxin I [Halolactibacillus alkaliphilus]
MKIAVAYASMTGNTECIADEVKRYLEEQGIEYASFHIGSDDFYALDLVDYDGIFFGSYTYGDGDLPFELMDFYDEVEDEDLTGRVIGLFGSCDSFYPLYGVALDQFKERFESAGATVVGELVKVDLDPDEDDYKRTRHMVDDVLAALKG